jgi:iron(III) transport system substrate-binding protein
MKIRVLATVAVLILVVGGVTAAGAGAAAGLCANPQKLHGFSTCADVAAAEKEGALVVYSPDVEQGTAKMLEAFQALFPKIKTSYVRLQTGALYAKVQAERQARSYLVDVLNLSDIGLAFDFYKRNGYQQYISPEMAAYKADFKSQPEGIWTWGSINTSGIAYNPKVVPPAEAPKEWEDLLNPKWKGVMSVKTSNSGLQHFTWYMLNKVLGPEYWNKLAQQQPLAFDSQVQQYDRLVNGQDKVMECAQLSGFLDYRKKGAPLEFVVPSKGGVAGPEVWGIVESAPHPQAARLFLDWFLSPAGQKPFIEALFMHAARPDVAPPPGALPLDKLNLLYPSDWQDFFASRPAYLKQWDAMVGRR